MFLGPYLLSFRNFTDRRLIDEDVTSAHDGRHATARPPLRFGTLLGAEGCRHESGFALPTPVAAARARHPISSSRWRHPCSVCLPVGLRLTFLACNATIALRRSLWSLSSSALRSSAAGPDSGPCLLSLAWFNSRLRVAAFVLNSRPSVMMTGFANRVVCSPAARQWQARKQPLLQLGAAPRPLP